VTTGWYTRHLDAACRLAGIPRCTPNDFRRTHATLLRNSGVDAKVTRALLGHTAGSVLLEQVYDKPTPQALAARAGDLGALTAAVAPLADSLHSSARPPAFTEENQPVHRPWGRTSYPASEERQAVSGSGPAETGSEPVEAAAESLHGADRILALAKAARAALHTSRSGVLTGTVIVRRRSRDAG